jgi:uncharacterized delta-60 repeat protein/uncharacterized repeat protein (TIGR01451 family)
MSIYRRQYSLLLLLLTSILYLSINNNLSAAEHHLDVSFDTDGIITFTAPDTEIQLLDILEIPTTKQYWALLVNSIENVVYLQRYDVNGVRDVNTVTTLTNLDIVPQPIGQLTIDSTGRIIAGFTGTVSNASAPIIGRYNSNGTPDLTFNGNHTGDTYVTNELNFIHVDVAYVIYEDDIILETSRFGGVSILPGDNILVAGVMNKFASTLDDAFFLSLNNVNGARNTAYGTNAVLQISIGNNVHINNFMKDSAGRFLAIGYSQFPPTNHDALTVIRLTSAGAIDTTFGSSVPSGAPVLINLWTTPTQGVITAFNSASVGDYQNLFAIAEDTANNRYIVGGRSGNQSILAGINYNGTGNIPFGFRAINLHAQRDFIVDLAIKPDQKIVVGVKLQTITSATPAEVENIAIYQLLPNGSLDTSFNGTGEIILITPTRDTLKNLRLLGDGHILIGGETNHKNNVVFYRYGQPEIDITPNDTIAPTFTYDMGSLNTTTTQTFTITNTTDIDLGNFTRTLTGSSGFSIDSTTCTTTLARNSSCTVTIASNPSGIPIGTYQATLTINSGNPAQANFLRSRNAPEVLTITAESLAVDVTTTVDYTQTTVAVSSETAPSQTFLEIEIDNDESSALTAVSFTKNIPAGLSYVGHTTTPSCGSGTVTTTSPFTVSGFSVPVAGTCTFSIELEGATAGSYTDTAISNLAFTLNTVNVTGQTSEPFTDTIHVVALPTIQKAFTPASVILAGASTSPTPMTITITNNDTTNALSLLSFTDNLHADLLHHLNGTNSCAGTVTPTAGNTIITYSGGSLAPNSSCQIVVQVVGSAIGVKPNQILDLGATIAGRRFDSTLSDTPADAIIEMQQASPANLTILEQPSFSKTFSPATVLVNSASTLTFTLNNTLSQALTLSFEDDLTAFDDEIEFDLASISGTCITTYGGNSTGSTLNSLDINAINLPANTACTVSVDIDTYVAGTYNNVSSVLHTDIGDTNITANASLLVLPEIDITKEFVPNVMLTGGTTSLVITLENTSSVDFTGVSFVDPIPAGSAFSYTSMIDNTCGGTVSTLPTTTLSLSNISLDAGDSCSLEIEITQTTPITGTFTNTTSPITISGYGTGSQVGTDDITVYVEPTISKAFTPSSIIEGNSSQLLITLNNPSSLTHVLSFEDDLSSFTNSIEFDLASLSGACLTTYGGNSTGSNAELLDINNVTLAGGETCSLTVDVIGNTAGTYNNQTSALHTQIGDAGNAQASLEVIEPLAITMSLSDNEIFMGEDVITTITVTNNTGVIQNNASFPFDLTPRLDFAVLNSVITDCNYNVTTNLANQFVIENFTLNANASCTFTLTFRQTPPQSGTVSFDTFPITTSLGTSHETASEDLNIYAYPTLSKAFNPLIIAPNTPAEMRFTLTNPVDGAPVLTGLALTEVLPTGLTIVPSTAGTDCLNGNAISSSLTTLVLTDGELNQNSSCDVWISVTGNVESVYTNLASNVTHWASTETGVQTPSFTPASLEITILPMLDKAFSPSFIEVDGISTLTFNISNPIDGLSSITGLTFTDSLPTGLVIADPTNASTDCVNGSVNATIGGDSISLVDGQLNAGESCQVMVDVTSSTVGQYTNAPANISNFMINELGSPISALFTDAILDVIPTPAVVNISTSEGTLTDDDVLDAEISALTVLFNVDLANVDNPINYMLLSVGDALESPITSCPISLSGDDSLIAVNSITYNIGTFSATLNVNNGDPLPNGQYVLVICSSSPSPLETSFGQFLSENVSRTFNILVPDTTPQPSGTPDPSGTPNPSLTPDPSGTPQPSETPDDTPTSVPAQPDIDVFDPAISKIGLLLPGELGLAGERLEWVTTVGNNGSATGFNVVVTDTLRPELRIDRVEAPNANVTINGQTVIVTYPTITAGQVFNFSIFTTVLRSDVEIDNTVCLQADNLSSPICTVGVPAGKLPNTGESPTFGIRIFRLLQAILFQ